MVCRQFLLMVMLIIYMIQVRDFVNFLLLNKYFCLKITYLLNFILSDHPLLDYKIPFDRKFDI